LEILGISPTIWFPVVTLIIGAVLKAIFDALTDRRAARREREARQEQRRDAFHLRLIEFQRSTLLELQEVASQLARFTGQAQHQDEMAYRASGTWGKQPLTDEVDQGFLKAQTDINRLRVRVRDPNIRQLAQQFFEACVEVSISKTKADSERAFHQVSTTLIELHEHIGATLSNLDSDEDQIGSS
jgi:hypothetical protein